ncbi:hypothetical protein SUDANB106_00260 [Streptomyces sp. enrichment culture]
MSRPRGAPLRTSSSSSAPKAPRSRRPMRRISGARSAAVSASSARRSSLRAHSRTGSAQSAQRITTRGSRGSRPGHRAEWCSAAWRIRPSRWHRASASRDSSSRDRSAGSAAMCSHSGRSRPRYQATCRAAVSSASQSPGSAAGRASRSGTPSARRTATAVPSLTSPFIAVPPYHSAVPGDPRVRSVRGSRENTGARPGRGAEVLDRWPSGRGGTGPAQTPPTAGLSWAHHRRHARCETPAFPVTGCRGRGGPGRSGAVPRRWRRGV